MLGRIDTGSVVRTGNETSVTLNLFGDHADELLSLEEKDLAITLKKHRNRRSNAASRLCWELCSQIGRALTPPIPKEEVYRQAIKDVGVFIQVCIRKGDYTAFDRQWQGRGTGWFTEITDTHDYRTEAAAPKGSAGLAESQTATAQIEDLRRGTLVDVMAYCGSSTYDTKEMSTLIDYLVDQAEQMELQIAYDLKEIEKIKEDWRFSAGQED